MLLIFFHFLPIQKKWYINAGISEYRITFTNCSIVTIKVHPVFQFSRSSVYPKYQPIIKVCDILSKNCHFIAAIFYEPPTQKWTVKKFKNRYNQQRPTPTKKISMSWLSRVKITLTFSSYTSNPVVHYTRVYSRKVVRK